VDSDVVAVLELEHDMEIVKCSGSGQDNALEDAARRVHQANVRPHLDTQLLETGAGAPTVAFELVVI
jgi:hypothetical protein